MDMSSKKRGLGTSFVALGAAVLIAVGASCALPARAQAADACVAHSTDSAGNRTDYKNWSDAVKDGQNNGRTIHMDADWVVTGTASSGALNEGSISVGDGKKLTIDMNGHKIDNRSSHFSRSQNTPTFSVHTNAVLTLTSSKKVEFSYAGYDDSSGERMTCKTTTGGLVTNTSNDMCGILVCESATLNLENVAVAGCRGDEKVNGDSDERYGGGTSYFTLDYLNGGVALDSNSVITMSRGASVEHNFSRNYGAGLYIEGSNVKVAMDNASIHDNYGSTSQISKGGGIYAGGTGVNITMENESKIRGNSAYGGGGVYFNKSQFSLTSDDGKAYIENNRATLSSTAEKAAYKSGGGIHVDKASGTNKGLIKNIRILRNHSECDGGGIELDQKATVVRGCTIEGNTCKYEGGGICDTNDNNKIDSSTVTGNACNVESDGNYGGGGVFVGCMSDIKLTGTCTIKGNTRDTNSGNADDLFLNENTGASAKAYITGSLDEGSSVGVRTGIAKADRRIAKNFSYPESRDCLFMDLDGYYVTYGTDEGGDAWQRYGTKEFSLKVNGGTVGRCKNGATATADGTSADATKVFKRWKEEGTSGLNPFSDYIKDADLTKPAVSFEMPQNDVDLAAEYVTRTKDVSLALAAPSDGSLLSSEGSVAWTSADGASGAETVAVAWYKKNGDGTLSLATGKAEDGTVYVARASLAQDVQTGRAFALDISGADVKVTWTGTAGATEPTAASVALVDASSGALSITSGEYTAAGATFTGIEDISLTFAAGTPKADFEAALPAKATAIKSNGGTKQFDIDWSGADFSAWFANGAIKSGLRDVTLYRPLKNTGGALPDSVRVAVSFSFTEAETETVAVPEVKPAAGTYGVSANSAKFDSEGTKMALTAECVTAGADIRYTLSRNDGSGWKAVVEDAVYGSGIDLTVVKGATASYKLEIWAVKGGVESQRETLYYTIEDDRKAETVGVTVGYADTAADGHHGSKKDDVHAVVKGGDVTLVAPDRNGYSFERWTDAEGKELGTDTTLKLEKIDAATTVTAVYNPVVTEIDVAMDAPVAHQALSQAAASVKVVAAGAEVDITDYLSNSHGSSNPAITWVFGAADDEGKAGHMTAYTASLKFEGGGAQADVKYAVAADAAVKCNGNKIDKGSAYVAEDGDGAERVYIAFPVTGAYEEPEVSKLDAIDMTFAEAWTTWTSSREQDGDGEQSMDDTASAWSLPDQVEVSYKCGESEMYDISWSSITGFDESATGAQMLTATGTITWPDHVDENDAEGNPVSNEVTVMVNVAAPETVATPTASLEPGKHKGAQKVELSCKTEGATIYYTVDGGDPEPGEEGTLEYTGAIGLAHSAAIRAVALCDGMAASKVAKFDYIIQHKVTFYGGTAGNTVTEWVDDGECVARPDDPELDGLRFEGWSTADGEEYDFAKTAVTADTALYAQWSKSGGAVHPHTVAFDSAGGSAVAEQHVVDGGRAAKPDDPELDGSKFEGWFTAAGDKYDFDTAVTADLILYAHWTVKGGTRPAHIVIFDTAGGSAVAAQTVADGGYAYEPAAPTNDGFAFDGWYADGAEEPYDFSAPVTGDLVLYARWSTSGDDVVAHLVTFDCSDGAHVSVRTVGDGERVERPADPTREGYEFLGWYADGSESPYDFSTPVTGDLTLYARWSKRGDGAVAHIVTFDSAGGTPVASQSVADGQRAERPADPTRAGYEFLGWTLDGEAYDFKTPVKTDLELTATWKKQESKKDDTEKDDGDKDDSGSTDEQKGSATKTTAVTTVTTSTGSTLAATGDRTLLIVGALVVLGLLAAAAGIVAKRKEK